MIVDPDFVDHWRTRMLVDSLGGDEMAPIYLMRLWAHCQTRKSDRFKMPPAGLKAQCRFAGDAGLFESSLTEAGFISREDGEVVVTGWMEKNASLVAAWSNGAKGGRPRKEDHQEENPEETHGLPMANPDQTHAKPIREEKRREELKPINPNGLIVADKPADHGKGPAKPDCPHQEIIALYHEVLPMCPRVREWTPARATQLRARWNEDERRQNMTYWRRFFEYVAGCDFLIGRTSSAGRQPFFADLEWIVKSANFTKIREEKYANKAAA